MPVLLLIAALTNLVCWIIILVKLFKGTRAAPPRAGGEAEKPHADEAKLVRCASCGAFVPRGEALPSPDGFRCGAPSCRAES